MKRSRYAVDVNSGVEARLNVATWVLPKHRWVAIGLVALLAFLVSLVAQGLGGITPEVAAATLVDTCGQNLDAPNGQYYLAGDLYCPDDAVIISASDVHFDLNGYAIEGGIIGACDNPGTGIILLAVSGVHINGGAVTGFTEGIELLGTSASQVNGMTVTHNCDFGIVLSGANNNAFYTNVVSDNVCNGVDFDSVRCAEDVASQPIGGGGYALFGSSGNVINSNDISRNGAVGVSLVGSGDNTIRSNTVNGNGFLAADTGIILDATSGGNTIRSNTVNGNDSGIVVFSNSNTVQGNIANGNQSVGIGIFGESNLIRSNTALGNGLFDLFDNHSDCDSNSWKANVFGTKNQACIH